MATVSGADLKITELPAANAAQTPPQGIAYGKFHGGTTTVTPVGDESFSKFRSIADHANAVRIGVASHNLFHIAFALEVAKKRKVLDQLDIEMLEGMAQAVC